jgi:hypothetical protein
MWYELSYGGSSKRCLSGALWRRGSPEMTSAEDSVAASEDVILAGRCWEVCAARAGYGMAIGRHRGDRLR